MEERSDATMVRRDRRHAEAGIERVVLAHPVRRNALSRALLQELDEVLAAIEAEGRVKVVILAGEGPAFSAGHDLRELRFGATDEVAAVFDACAAVMTRIRTMAAIVVAEIEGVATAAGCQLLATADLAVAGADARFATPGVKIGYFCTTPGVALGRSVGRKAALEMLLTGDFASADEARSMGLINVVVPPGKAETEAFALAGRVARHARATLVAGKRDFYRQLEMPEAEALRFASGIMVEQVARDEAREGMSAFLEKREPVWPD
jgi:enoyl-CoA hydratase/carnithine racemase